MAALCRDPAFFEACPEFAWLQETAAQVLAAFDESAARRCCGGNFLILQPLVDIMVTLLVDWKTTQPAAVSVFREYVRQKRGLTGAKLVLYYRRSSKGRIGKIGL